MRQWLQDCRSGHSECQQEVKIQPTRLLDLSSVALSGEVKLVLTADIPVADVRYAALSHCWGTDISKPPPKTNCHNQQDHMRGILLTDLPKNFQDAVAISLKLGIPYLWIDSLCILQDDKEEWEQEAMKMAHIYEGGVLTIAAAGSRDTYGGIINGLDQPTYTIPRPHNKSDKRADAGDQVRAEAHHDSLIIWQQYDQRLFHSSMDSNYRQRGWILQELALSPRTVFFTKGPFFWQCRRFFEPEDKAYRSSQFEALFKTYANMVFTFNLSDRKSAFDVWWQWVDNYAGRRLSVASDASAAFAGLVGFFQRKTGCTPMLGLWEEQLALQLSWNIGQSQMNPRKISCTTIPVSSDFPSWSWLSVVPNHTNGCNFSTPYGFGHRHTASVRVVEFAADWKGPEYTSKLCHSRLRVSGLTKHVTITTVADGNKYSRWPRCDWDRNGVPSLGTDWSCSLQYEYPPGTCLSVLLLHLYQIARTAFEESHSGTLADYFLILMEDARSAGRYYRIGVGMAVTHYSRKMDEIEGIHQEPVFLNSEREIIELI